MNLHRSTLIALIASSFIIGILHCDFYDNDEFNIDYNDPYYGYDDHQYDTSSMLKRRLLAAQGGAGGVVGPYYQAPTGDGHYNQVFLTRGVVAVYPTYASIDLEPPGHLYTSPRLPRGPNQQTASLHSTIGHFSTPLLPAQQQQLKSILVTALLNWRQHNGINNPGNQPPIAFILQPWGPASDFIYDVPNAPPNQGLYSLILYLRNVMTNNGYQFSAWPIHVKLR